MKRWRLAADHDHVQHEQWIHLTSRLSPSAPDLSAALTGSWLWTHLREAFPHAIAATIMPDHPHIVVASEDPEADRQRLARLLGQFGRKFGVWGHVARTPTPATIRSGEVLARQIRYVALNPCRARLVTCPLAWPWSTHRDVVGAVLDPWVTDERLAAALGQRARGFAARHHAYVSGDPRACVEGTPLPTAAESTDLPSFSLRSIAEAVASATRTPLDAVRHRGVSRALFVALAFDQGWGHVGRLAQLCSCSARTVMRLSQTIDHDALRIARLCLGDARLRRGPDNRDSTSVSASLNASDPSEAFRGQRAARP